MSLADHIRTESARLAALCTACGECVRACPMVPYAPGVAESGPEAVAAGLVDVLRDGPGTEAARAWIAACTRSGVCTPACPERIDPAFMLRLATWRAKGALGAAPLIPVKEDPQLPARVKAFARLTMTEEEQRAWL
ncbi:(Fe-S)-binding protein [Belnapia sp. T6]|uniref:(Fe-S)-binding protein n=1 Tax=Belnapia mucosa TaxID=2804532 RepID=A0ABS1V3B4_9PROT|nr:(Fe-S)-binding protein [Belnapia mucosa]MBL6456178.1 (Fe-S)-binding protein [Belnapia mucosa]